jgi:hypothetical protein
LELQDRDKFWYFHSGVLDDQNSKSLNLSDQNMRNPDFPPVSVDDDHHDENEIENSDAIIMIIKYKFLGNKIWQNHFAKNFEYLLKFPNFYII